MRLANLAEKQPEIFRHSGQLRGTGSAIMSTYTNTADAVAQAIFANQDISQYSFDDTNDYIGIVPKGTLLGYFYQLAGTQNAQPSLNDPGNQYSGLGNLPWIELSDATNSVSTFYLFGENLFYLPNGSFLSISNTTTPGLPANTYGGRQPAPTRAGQMAPAATTRETNT